MIHTVGATKMLLKSLPKTLPQTYHVIKKGLPLLTIHTPQIGATVYVGEGERRIGGGSQKEPLAYGSLVPFYL